MENEIKNSIYTGMSIYIKLENLKIRLRKDLLTQEHKKYLSLYLGILNTKNQISSILNPQNKSLNIEVKYNHLDSNEYLEIYENNFSNILLDINFESWEDYLNYLLDKDVIKEFNTINNIKINKLPKISNKQLVKK